MKRLCLWLIETERKLSTPLVYQHCDFVEVEEHISRQQVTHIGHISVCLHLFYHHYRHRRYHHHRLIPEQVKSASDKCTCVTVNISEQQKH